MIDVGVAIAIGLALIVLVAFYASHVRLRPVRARFLSEGARLLESRRLSENQKSVVRTLLDDATDWRFAIAAFFLFVPMIVFKIVARRKGVRVDQAVPGLRDLNNNPTAETFLALHVKCALWSNPVFAVLFLAEAAIIAAVGRVAFGSWGHSVRYIEQSLGWLAVRMDGPLQPSRS